MIRNAPPSGSARRRADLGDLPIAEMAVWSGDTVRKDEDGFLYFLGRARRDDQDLGLPGQPDRDRAGRPRLAAAAEAVVVGVEDARLGQRVVLVAAPPPGDGTLEPDALLSALRGALPAFMVPAEVVVRTSIPRSPNGKYDRTRVRAEYES